MTLVWEQKLHLFIRKYCKGYTYVEGNNGVLGVYLQILEFVLTFHARLESVGLIYTVYPG